MNRYIRLFEEHNESTISEVNRLRQLGLMDELDFTLVWSGSAHEWLFDWSQDKERERESARNWQLSDGRYLTKVWFHPPNEEQNLRWLDGLLHLTFNDGSQAVMWIVPTSNHVGVKMKDASIGRTLAFGYYIPHVIEQAEKNDRLLAGLLDWFNSEWTDLMRAETRRIPNR